MLEVSRPQRQRYAISVGSVLLALLLSLLVEPWLKLDTSLLFFFAAIVFSSGFGGLRPGMVATILAVLASDFFFLPPLYSLSIDLISDGLQLVVFGLVSMAMSGFNANLLAAKQLTHVTERKQAEAALQESEERYRSLVRATSQMVWITAPEGQVIDMPDWRAYTGQTQEQVKGWGWLESLHPDDRERTAQVWSQAVQARSVYDTEYRVRGADGIYRYFSARGVPVLTTEGNIREWVGICTDITDRKQVELALQTSEARLRRIVDSNIVGFFFGDMSGNITEANDAFLKLMGYTREELQAGALNWSQMTPPEHMQRTEQAVNELRQNRVCIPFEKEFFCKDGSRVAVVLAAALFEDQPEQGFACVIDITERKHIEAERNRNELLFRTLANTMPQIVWVTQPDGYHEYFNQRWYDYTGAELEQTRGEGWKIVLHPEDVQRTNAIWQHSLQTGTTYEIEYRLRRADGEYRWHLGRALPLRDQSERIIKWFGSCTDIHDQKLAAEERARALEQERAARLELEKANRLKDEFLAIVSHELRSPLNPIVGWSQILRTRKLSAAKTEHALEIIERNAKLQAHLVEDLLDVSRILRGQFSLDLYSVDLVIPIEAALETVRLTAEEKSIELKFSIVDERLDNPENDTDGELKISSYEPQSKTLQPAVLQPETLTVLGDGNRLQQIVWNLLSNAIKFTAAGGKIEVTLRRIKDYAQIIVTDTGKGISPDFLPYVFERFRQADEATTRHFGGLGLGLAIVRHLVELHGGSVQADSLGEGLGATFTVTLPLVDAAPTHSFRRLTGSSSALNGLRILVVDDAADTLNLLTFVLQEHGAEVIAVTSAAQALETILTTPLDLLLSDVAMPHLDGYGLMRQVRALEGTSRKPLPAIALTAFAGETDREDIISVGFQQHLTKPIEPAKLVEAVANLIRRDR